MADKISIKLDKPTQIFEINGVDHTVYYDDEALKRYENILYKFNVEYEKTKAIDIDSLTEDEKSEIRSRQEKLVEELINSIFGDNSYSGIYEAAGKSTFNILSIVEAFADWLGDKLSKFKKKKMDYYTQKSRK